MTDGLNDALASLSWEERAKLDNGQPIAKGEEMSRTFHEKFPSTAPATDEDGRDCWNVWVDGDQSSPHSFYSPTAATRFATRKQDDGHRVFTDFWEESGDSGEVFDNGCS